MFNYIDKINNKIEDIRKSIYDYNLKVMFSNINDLVIQISEYINSKEISKKKINIFNNILENINSSIQNKDYQLTSDILKFQLKDFVNNM